MMLNLPEFIWFDCKVKVEAEEHLSFHFVHLLKRQTSDLGIVFVVVVVVVEKLCADHDSCD